MLILDAIGMVAFGLLVGIGLSWLTSKAMSNVRRSAYNLGYEDGSNNKPRKEIYR